MNQNNVQSLLHAPLHAFSADDWPEWYASVAELVDHDDPGVRAAAVERLSMAALWAEHFSSHSGNRTDDEKRSRAAWLTEVIDQASCRTPDVTLFFLNELRHKGDEPPCCDIIATWLRGLLGRQPAGVPADRIEGAIVLVAGIEPWEGSLLPPLLADPSAYVRACAAHRLGRTNYGMSEDGLLDRRFIAELTAQELVRPGIAGPYWSATGLTPSDFDRSGFDPVDWMLGIIEQRCGPEPEEMPFNGIDFHIHELAAGNPQAIGRLIDAGRSDLVIMTATEIRDAVPAMEPLLCKLADEPDSRIALPAQIHLAHYHGVLHPSADPERIRLVPNWRDGAKLFTIRYGEPGRFSNQAVVFPDGRTTFDDMQARSIADAVLPPGLRGEPVPHYLDAHDAAPGPYRLGRDEMYSYASGATITLVGAIDGPGWRRIDISPGRMETHGDLWTATP